MLLSYIVFLHQTTTTTMNEKKITQLSYIVFLHQTTTVNILLYFIFNCLISSFYIKPQQYNAWQRFYTIVLYRLSTSNHNCKLYLTDTILLSYIVFLHQTTTLVCTLILLPYCLISSFYIKPQLISTPFLYLKDCLISSFYIKPQLSVISSSTRADCLISSFYIKPQHCSHNGVLKSIVLYRLSTSNHNLSTEVPSL